jgi:hypothetical protein
MKSQTLKNCVTSKATTIFLAELFNDLTFYDTLTFLSLQLLCFLSVTRCDTRKKKLSFCCRGVAPEHSPSQHGSATAWLTLEWLANVIHVAKTFNLLDVHCRLQGDDGLCHQNNKTVDTTKETEQKKPRIF